MVKIEKYEIFDTCNDRGRGLRSTLHLKPGEEILKETPLVKTLTNSKYRGVRCDFCFNDPEKLFKCSKCKYVWYCGKNCQSGDWEIHKHECKCLVKVAPKQPPDICRLVSHLLFKYYTKNKKATTNSVDKDTSEIERLVDNRDQMSSARKEAFFTFSGVLFDYLQGFSFTSDADIYGLLCKISCNSFTVTNSELNSLGTGLYNNASLINHSCNPNCVAIFEGTTVSIRTIREVECEEELLMSYVNLLATSDVRQMELNEGYMFSCTCDICKGKGLNDFMMKSFKCSSCKSCLQSTHTSTGKTCSCNKDCKPDETRTNEANQCIDELEALYNEINIIPTVEQQKKLQRNLEKGEDVLGTYNIAMAHSYEVAMDGCLDTNNWKGALELSKKLEKVYLVYLTKYHPSIGLHYFKQGKLELHLSNLREGINCLQKAMNVLSVSHGEGHSLVKLLKQQLEGACHEMAQREEYETIERIYKEEE